MKSDGSHKYNPSLRQATKTTTKGTPYSITDSYYVDDTAFILLNRRDLEEASKLIVTHFKRFGLTVHCGDKRNNAESKTEAMFFPAPGQTVTPADTADIMINEHNYFGFCMKFKYLGTIFTVTLNDSADVTERIKKASGAFAVMRRMLTCKSLPERLRVKAYEATVLNILLYGCECWALKESDRSKLEACHHRFLRSILQISMLDVKENSIRNETIREQLGCHSLHTHMELRRARWIEKIANMPESRNPRKVFITWTPQSRPTQRPQQTIRHGYATTIEKSLNFQDSRMNSWMPTAKSHKLWAKQVEQSLNLPDGTYKPFKLRR